MKRLFMLLGLLVLSTAFVWAQSGTSNTGSSGNNSATSSSSSTSADQNQTSTGAAGTSSSTAAGNSADQNANQAGAASGQSGAAADRNDATPSSSKSKSGRLPQTASPLPFLGLIGFGSLAAGALVRKIRG